MSTHVVVDGANVVGSRPDGWWRDRPGAARRLAAQLIAVLATDPVPLAGLGGTPPDGPVLVHLVLEGDARRADVPIDPALHVVRAPADGDATIVELATTLSPARVVVVTADQGLRRRVQRVGAVVVGPRVLRALLPEAPVAALPAEHDGAYSRTGEQSGPET